MNLVAMTTPIGCYSESVLSKAFLAPHLRNLTRIVPTWGTYHLVAKDLVDASVDTRMARRLPVGLGAAGRQS